jgi:hypothetical protein
MCVHEVSDADQQLINTFKSTTTSPSSSVVVTTPKTPSKGNGGGEHQCDPDTGKICFSSDYGLCIPTIGCSSYGKNYGNNKGTNNVVCDPGTKTICYSSKHGFCIPTLGCSGPAEDEFDGMGFGFGGSAGIPILQANSAGLEALTFFDTGEDAEYSYGGLSSSSVTAGISGGPYGIILFNTHNTSDYSGQFNVVNLTALMLWECQ